MAIETVRIPLDETWRLVSNTAAGAFSATYDGGEAHIFLSNSAPDAKSLGEFTSVFATPALTKKVWARSGPFGSGVLTVTRTVDSGNPALPILGALALSATTVALDAAPGTLIANITGKTDGSKIDLDLVDGRFYLSEDGTKLFKGDSRLSAGDVAIKLIEKFRKAGNTPRVNNATITVSPAPALTITGTPEAGNIGDRYIFTPTISGGSPPYRVRAGGIGRSGLAVNEKTGRTAGILKNAGRFSPEWTVTDSRGVVARLTGKPIVVTDPANPNAGGDGAVIRGLGNGMQSTITALEGGATWGRVTRTSHFSNKKFKRSRVSLPTSYFTGSTPMVETDLAASLKFMVSLEPVFFEGLTGIPARSATYLFAASKVALYNGPGTNPTRRIVSDWLDHVEIPANQKFGLWTTVENQLGASSPANSLPTSWPTSSAVSRNEGSRSNTAQDVGVSYIDTLATETRTLMSAFLPGVGGGNSGFWPAMLEVEYESGERVVFLLGDSMTEGAGLGSIGPGATDDVPPILGDVMGGIRRNRGYAAVGLDAMGINYVNAGKGSDGYKNLSVDGNMVARLEMLKATNPPFAFMGNVFNDVGTADATFIAQVAKVYDLIEAAVPGIKLIQALAVPFCNSTRAVQSLVYNNAANLATVTVASTADLVQGQRVTHSGGSVAGLNIRAVINITSATTYTFSPPAALGADQTPTGTILYNNEFRSPAGQTYVNASFNPATLTNSRSSKNQMIRSKSGPFARCFAIFDPNLVCEEGYTGTQASETGKWKASPDQSFRWTWDGGHQNNNGQGLLGLEYKRQAEAGGWFA